MRASLDFTSLLSLSLSLSSLPCAPHSPTIHVSYQLHNNKNNEINNNAEIAQHQGCTTEINEHNAQLTKFQYFCNV